MTHFVCKASAISQPTWPTQPAIPLGLVKLVKINDGLRQTETYSWLALPVAGYRVAALSLCVQVVGGDLNGLVAQFQ